MMDAKYEEAMDRTKRAKELAEGLKAPVVTAEQESHRKTKR
jgi:DNA-directed RNA polymerase subunit K/omega